MQYLHPQGQVERRTQFQWNEKALLNKVHKLIYIEREREREAQRERIRMSWKECICFCHQNKT